jgi:putative transposase
MTPSGAWARSNCSWRDRQLMMRAGPSRTYGTIADDPLDRLKEDKMEELKERRKSAKNRSSKLALTIQKIEVQQRTVANMAGGQMGPLPDATSGAEVPKTKSDPFDLRSIPDID